MNNFAFIIFMLTNISFFFVCSDSLAMTLRQGEEIPKNSKEVSAEQALLIAEKTQEAQGFYNLRNRKFFSCIEKKVLEPCQSRWVTCIEDAWVVEFTLGEDCGVTHDGRVSLRILIDADAGKIISRFPEAPYFENSRYCLEDYDCMTSNGEDETRKECSNFIYAQTSQMEVAAENVCVCKNNICLKMED